MCEETGGGVGTEGRGGGGRHRRKKGGGYVLYKRIFGKCDLGSRITLYKEERYNSNKILCFYPPSPILFPISKVPRRKAPVITGENKERRVGKDRNILVLLSCSSL